MISQECWSLRMADPYLPRIAYCYAKADECHRRAERARTARARVEYEELAALWKSLANDVRYIERVRPMGLIAAQPG